MCEKCGFEEKHLRLAMQSAQNLSDLYDCLIESCEKKAKARKDVTAVNLLASAERVGCALDLVQLAFPGLESTDDPKLAGEILECEGIQ